MKYRIYRVIGKVEYKDIIADTPEEAIKAKYCSKFDTVTDDGYILWSVVDTKFDKEKRLGDLREEGCYV